MATARVRSIVNAAQRRFGPVLSRSTASTGAEPPLVVPFQPGNFSTGGEVLNAALSLIQHARDKRARQEREVLVDLFRRKTEAEIANIESQAAARNQPLMPLELPGQDTGIIGPPQPQTVMLKPEDYARERRLMDQNAATGDYRASRLGQYERGLSLAEQRLGLARKIAGGTKKYLPAQAELTNIDRAEKRTETELANMGEFRAQQLQQSALHGKGEEKADALRTLGLSQQATPEEVLAASQSWATRFTRSGMVGVRAKNEPSRQAAEAVTREAAGLQSAGQALGGLSDIEQQTIDALRQEFGGDSEE